MSTMQSVAHRALKTISSEDLSPDLAQIFSAVKTQLEFALLKIDPELLAMVLRKVKVASLGGFTKDEKSLLITLVRA